MDPVVEAFYETEYDEICETGLRPHHYTVTDYYTGPTYGPHHPDYIPPGFTRTTAVCDVCDDGYPTKTLTVPCHDRTPRPGYGHDDSYGGYDKPYGDDYDSSYGDYDDSYGGDSYGGDSYGDPYGDYNDESSYGNKPSYKQYPGGYDDSSYGPSYYEDSYSSDSECGSGCDKDKPYYDPDDSCYSESECESGCDKHKPYYQDDSYYSESECESGCDKHKPYYTPDDSYYPVTTPYNDYSDPYATPAYQNTPYNNGPDYDGPDYNGPDYYSTPTYTILFQNPRSSEAAL